MKKIILLLLISFISLVTYSQGKEYELHEFSYTINNQHISTDLIGILYFSDKNIMIHDINGDIRIHYMLTSIKELNPEELFLTGYHINTNSENEPSLGSLITINVTKNKEFIDWKVNLPNGYLLFKTDIKFIK